MRHTLSLGSIAIVFTTRRLKHDAAFETTTFAVGTFVVVTIAATAIAQSQKARICIILVTLGAK